MENSQTVLIAAQRVSRPRPMPRLRLLIDWEPRRRVFFENLTDLVLRRPMPHVTITSKPARFWTDVFVPSGVSWAAFMEAAVVQLLVVVLFVWSQSRVWTSVKLFSPRDAVHKTITYYPPKPSFRASEGRAPSVRTRSRTTHTSAHAPPHQRAHPSPMAVTPQQKPSLLTPPDIKQVTAQAPNLAGSRAVTPIVPFPATAGPRRNGLGSPGAAVAPAPQVDQAGNRRLAAPQSAPVAPAPELAASAGRSVKAVNAGSVGVVQPPPAIQNTGRSGGFGSLSAAGSNVVQPPPSIQGASSSGRSRLGAVAGAGPQAVPPPPSVQSAGNSARGTRAGSFSGTGSNVIQPPPSVTGTGSAATNARLGSINGTGSQVVPPPPSVQGAGNSARGTRVGALASGNVVPPPPSVGGGNMGGNSRVGAVSGSGTQVVPPSPSLQGSSGGMRAGTRAGSLSGSGSDVVPPPPSVQGAGNSGSTGRLGSLAPNGPATVAPPPATAGRGSGGNSSTGKLLEPMDPLPGMGSLGSLASTADAGAAAEDNSSVEELPLGLIGVVFSPQGSSFFANFEVFVAKRRVGKDQLQLIKLVYEFLPYQKRLSEYDLNSQPVRTIKLKVTPDPGCDESLGQMIQSHIDSTAANTPYAKLPPALGSADPNEVLPCYRTNAGDFQRAMTRGK